MAYIIVLSSERQRQFRVNETAQVLTAVIEQVPSHCTTTDTRVWDSHSMV